MSSTNYSNPDPSGGACSYANMGRRCGGHWSGANIAAMVLGFVVWPPLGLVVLVWTIAGHPIQALPAWVRDKWRRFFRGASVHGYSESDNTVFNEYQQTQYDRIHEIKEEIRNRARAFRDFRFNARRRQDQKEFDEFMATKPEEGRDND